MTFDAEIQAMTQTYLAPKVVDTILTENVLALRLFSNAGKFIGPKMGRTVQVAKKSNGGSFSGLDKFNTNIVRTKVKMEFDLRAYQEPIVIPGMERDAVQNSKEATVNLVKQAMEEAGNSAVDGIGAKFYLDGTGNSSKDFLGLEALVDDGGEVASIGGLSRSTYTTLQAAEYDITSSISLAALGVAISATTFGADRPTLIVCNPDEWDALEELCQPMIALNQQADGHKMVTAEGVKQNASALKGEVGFAALWYRGIPIVADPSCPTGKVYGLNEKHLKWFGMASSDSGYTPIEVGGNKEIDGVYEKSIGKNMGFNFSGLKNPIDQYAQVGHIILLGNLITFSPNRHFVLNIS